MTPLPHRGTTAPKTFLHENKNLYSQSGNAGLARDFPPIKANFCRNTLCISRKFNAEWRIRPARTASHGCEYRFLDIIVCKEKINREALIMLRIALCDDDLVFIYELHQSF